MDSGGGAAPPPAGDEEEARRRRGTDCVYYLASPLTCKKGSECEYRHSDAARANPRDCWYWFNGNCVNPKCSFRHPPLDDMLGAPATPRASQQSAPQGPVPAQAPASGAAKPGVPCYYFQKGMCAKGNLCAFSHVPQFAGNPALHQTAKGFAPAVQPHLQSKNSNSWIKPSGSAAQQIPAMHNEAKVSARNGLVPAQQQSRAAYNTSRAYQNHSNSYVLSGAVKSYQPQPLVEDETAETGEFVRELSAGSSVVAGSVDDDAEGSFKEVHNSYRRTSQEQNTGARRQAHGGYELEQSHRSSSDRLVSERRLSSQREPVVPVTANSSDLRHRLLKQRRLSNDPRSTQVPDRWDRRYPEDERHSDHRRRGEEQATHDSLSRSRLHGRIKLPGETSSLDRLGPYSEKERRPRDRLSPPKQTDLRAKIHDRLKARSNEDVPANNVRSSVVKASSCEDAAGVVNFSGPKSLAELRAKKVAASSSMEYSPTTKKADWPVRMTSEIVTNRVSPEPVPFDCPKPLSAILKRKREADSGSIQKEQITDEEEQSLNNNSIILENDAVGANTEEYEEEEGEAFNPEDDLMYDDSLSPVEDNGAEDAANAGKEELEEGEQQEENLETAEEEYEYEAADDVNVEEDKDYQEYEDNDDDLEDDDDFARKVGVLIS